MRAVVDSKSTYQNNAAVDLLRQLLDLVRRIRWFNFSFLVLIPLAGIVQALWVHLCWKTLIWSATYYVLTAGSITIGERAHFLVWEHTSD